MGLKKGGAYSIREGLITGIEKGALKQAVAVEVNIRCA